jgi:hypothetical protein
MDKELVLRRLRGMSVRVREKDIVRSPQHLFAFYFLMNFLMK